MSFGGLLQYLGLVAQDQPTCIVPITPMPEKIVNPYLSMDKSEVPLCLSIHKGGVAWKWIPTETNCLLDDSDDDDVVPIDVTLPILTLPTWATRVEKAKQREHTD